MFKYLGIISILLSITAVISPGFTFGDQVGTIENNKPSWYAVIGTENKGKKLYVKGDIFSSGDDPAKSLRVADITKDSLVLEGAASKNSVVVKLGETIPIEGSGAMIFEKTVESSVLEYNYNKPPEKITRNQLEDFTIKSLEKRKIVLEKSYNAPIQVKQLSSLEKEIFNSPRDPYADKKAIIIGLFNKIESKKIDDNMWALDRSSAEPAMRNAGAALMSAIKRVEPGYRFGQGPSLKFNTDIGVAVVNKEGFLVQDITVARFTENFGVKEGDVIKSVNGYSVNSLLGLYRAYENIASNKSAGLLSVNIARDGKTKTLVYKIR